MKEYPQDGITTEYPCEDYDPGPEYEWFDFSKVDDHTEEEYNRVMLKSPAVEDDDIYE